MYLYCIFGPKFSEPVFIVQLHNLESILGDLRGSSSDFYPDQAGGGGASDAANKPQGCLEDGLQGKRPEANNNQANFMLC